MKQLTGSLKAIAGSGVLAILALGCSGSEFVAKGNAGGESNGDDGGGVGWGGGGSVAEPVKPAVCDRNAEDDPDPESLDSNCDGIDGNKSRAIFVSPLGDDEAAGTLEAPVETLGRAIELASVAGFDVYACSATYEENLVVSGSSVRLFGGFACEDGWKRKRAPAEVAPPSGIPLRIVDIQLDEDTPLLIDGFRFVAPDATEPGESSVAASIVGSLGVRLSRTELVAGKGADAGTVEEAKKHTARAHGGTKGDDAPNESTFNGDSCYTIVPPTNCRPGDICEPLRIWKDSCRRTAENTIAQWKCSSSSQSCTPTLCETDTGTVSVGLVAGGSGGNGFRSPEAQPSGGGRFEGTPGAKGADGAHGLPDTLGFGSISKEGLYLATNAGGAGKFGKIGNSGRGGAGALASYDVRGVTFIRQIGGAGGSSGKSGCGGYPGKGGLAGGASLGLIVVESDVVLERVTIRTADGGRGGAPTVGSEGQKGGPGGKGGLSSTRSSSAAPYGKGEDGVKGGDGGKGGSGAPGGGGPSIGLVVVGPEPSLKAMSFEIGSGGQGGEPLADTRVARGARGIERDVYVVPQTEE